MWELYKKQPGFVLGFHGCDEAIAEKVLASNEHLKASTNDYDWLGGGIYFWEGNPARALEFAQQAAGLEPKVSKGRIGKPCVIGAIIDLGLCCNLLDSSALAELAATYKSLAEAYDAAGVSLPANKGEDRRLRFLDCLSIETMHILREDGEGNDDGAALPAYDSVRGAFWEGGDLYPNAGFAKKAHIQIAVRNPDCIKGYFRPLKKA
jgi:hypothetical protein